MSPIKVMGAIMGQSLCNLMALNLMGSFHFHAPMKKKSPIKVMGVKYPFLESDLTLSLMAIKSV